MEAVLRKGFLKKVYGLLSLMDCVSCISPHDRFELTLNSGSNKCQDVGHFTEPDSPPQTSTNPEHLTQNSSSPHE